MERKPCQTNTHWFIFRAITLLQNHLKMWVSMFMVCQSTSFTVSWEPNFMGFLFMYNIKKSNFTVCCGHKL